jgi:hypothetical protein
MEPLPDSDEDRARVCLDVAGVNHDTNLLDDISVDGKLIVMTGFPEGPVYFPHYQLTTREYEMCASLFLNR